MRTLQVQEFPHKQLLDFVFIQVYELLFHQQLLVFLQLRGLLKSPQWCYPRLRPDLLNALHIYYQHECDQLPPDQLLAHACETLESESTVLPCIASGWEEVGRSLALNWLGSQQPQLVFPRRQERYIEKVSPLECPRGVESQRSVFYTPDRFCSFDCSKSQP